MGKSRVPTVHDTFSVRVYVELSSALVSVLTVAKSAHGEHRYGQLQATMLSANEDSSFVCDGNIFAALESEAQRHEKAMFCPRDRSAEAV